MVSGHSCVTSSGFIYCVGGSRGFPAQFYDSVYYAPLNNTGIGPWSKTTSYPTKITGESCVASSGYIYCVGGKSATGSSTFVDSVYFAQLTTSGVGAWSNTTRYPLKTQSPSCVTSSGYVYCVGGYTAESPTNSVGSVFYTSVTSSGVGAWTNTTAYPTPHGQSSCVATEGYIYCAGNAAHGRAPINSSGVGAWSKVGYPGPGGPPGCDNYESTAFGYLYCIGSMSSGQLSAYVYYASVNYTSPDDWLRTADYPMPVTGESCITSKGYVYCVAGVSSGGEVNSAYFSQIVHPLSGKPTNSWVADQGARLSSPPSASPAGIQLPDGRIRLYFCQERVKPAAPGPPGPPPANSQVFVIRSAISRDGLNFTLEPGIRINATGKPGDPRFTVCNPTIVMLKDATYRIYYNGINSSQLTPLGPTNHTMWRIYTAKSDDGLTFTDDKLAIDPTNSTWALLTRDKWAALPTARLLPDGRIKIYYEGTGPAQWCPSLCGRAESVVSNDGVHFTWEGAVEFLTSNPKVPPLFNHSWVLLPDGTNMLILYPDRGDLGHPLGFYASYSSGGLVFSSPVEVLPAPRDVNLTAFGPPPLTDPELVPLSDGSYRLYYDAIRGSQQQEVDSARWSPLLPEKTEVENVTAVSGNYSVAISHNSSISGFAFDLSSFSISLNLGGPVGFHGHAKISFPTALLSGTIRATLDGSPAQVQINKTGTQTSVGFTFEQGTYTLVQIFGTRSGSLTKTTSSATSSSSTASSSTSTSSSSMSSSTSVTSSSSYSTTSSIAPNISNVNYLLTGLMVAAALVGTTELFLLVRRK